MLGLDLFQILLLIAAIAALIFHFIQDKKSWVKFYDTNQGNMEHLHFVHAHLKRNGVKCRLKNRSQTFNHTQNPQLSTAVIEIKKGEKEKANRILKEIDKQ